MGYNGCQMRSNQEESQEKARRHKTSPHHFPAAAPAGFNWSSRRAARNFGRLFLGLQIVLTLRRRACGCSRIWSSCYEAAPVVRFRSAGRHRDNGGETLLVIRGEYLSVAN